MTEFPYISREQAENFLNEFAMALENPKSYPLLFHVWGIGGVGKSTLLDKLQEKHPEASFARVYFGRTTGIETPLKLIARLYNQLPPTDGWQELFTSRYEQYQHTLKQLEAPPSEGKQSQEKQSVDKERLNILKRLASLGAKAVSKVAPIPGIAASGLEKAAEASVDAASLMQQLLQQHQATKRNKELQALMLEPIPKLTQAFVEGIIQKAQQRPVVLILDTYEKVTADIDTWLWQYLLEHKALKNHKVRIVVEDGAIC